MKWLTKLIEILIAAWKQYKSGETTTTPVPTPEPVPSGDSYTVSSKDAAKSKSLAVPAWLEFTIKGKAAGNAEREEVTVWAVTENGDWSGGNGKPGTFTVRLNDSRPDWAKLKVYGVDKYAGEPALNMAWDTKESYTIHLAVESGKVWCMATRVSDGKSAKSEIDCKTPERVTLSYGNPGSRKCAEGAVITNVKWSA